MLAYHEIIQKFTGATESAQIGDIEQIMRLQNGGTLDNLSPVLFKREARIAFEVASLMADTQKERHDRR